VKQRHYKYPEVEGVELINRCLLLFRDIICLFRESVYKSMQIYLNAKAGCTSNHCATVKWRRKSVFSYWMISRRSKQLQVTRRFSSGMWPCVLDQKSTLRFGEISWPRLQGQRVSQVNKRPGNTFISNVGEFTRLHGVTYQNMATSVITSNPAIIDTLITYENRID
jgi:hypothetical protein